MSRLRLSLLAAAGLATAAACTQNAFRPIAMTKDASAVTKCEKIADLQAEPGRFDNSDAEAQLQREAREKGANTVLVTDANNRAGTAYRCAMPSVASPGGGSSR